MNSFRFDVDDGAVRELAAIGQEILEKSTGKRVSFTKDGIEALDRCMIELWSGCQQPDLELADEEQELLGYLSAFLGECVIQTLGGKWGRSGPFFDEHYFIRIPIPSGIPYDIIPGIRVTRSYFDPLRYSIRDWYLRAELAVKGHLDPLLNGTVEKMIVPSIFGRVIIQRQPDLNWVNEFSIE